MTLASVPNYGLTDGELKQVILRDPLVWTGGRLAAGGPESDGWCGGAIGIVGIASYGTKGWVEFGLGAEELIEID